MATDKASAPLEDLMVAMDVVDTLRHEESMVARELDGEARRQRLLERLREIYSAQGIDVPDQVLQQGIQALEQERFQYKPVARSWRTRLAHMWVSRARWGKPLLFLLVVGAIMFAVYFAMEVLPKQQLRSQLPNQVDASIAAIIAKAKNPEVIERASQLADDARIALDQDNLSDAQQSSEQLASIQRQLNQSYRIRIVSRANQNSGIWRRPTNNSGARNYYLIVEAIDADNKVVEVDVLSEEDNSRARKKVWGLRVDESVFHAVAADKQDDGIIQGNVVGEKRVGYLEHDYLIETSGTTITEW